MAGLETSTELLGLIMECWASIGRNVLGGGLDCNHNHLFSPGHVNPSLCMKSTDCIYASYNLTFVIDMCTFKSIKNISKEEMKNLNFDLHLKMISV